MSRKKSNGFESGIPWYTEMRLTTKVFFPTDHISCNYCRFCRYEEGYKRYRCKETNEWLIYPFDDIGRECPLRPVKKRGGNKNEQHGNAENCD